MEDVPGEAIERAEDDAVRTAHDHSGVTAQDGSLSDHVVTVHGLDLPAGVSPATAEGLHDRLHDTSKAADA